MIGILEFGLRIFTDYNSKWNIRLGAAKLFDPVTRFRNQPHYDFGDGAVTNERGYLAPEGLRPEKPDGKLRFVFLGDSVTFLPPAANYPRELARLVGERTGRVVEVVNTAVPGFSSENARALFESEVSRLRGDVLFVYLGWNDLGQFGPEGLPYKRQEAGYSLSSLQRILSSSYTIRLFYAMQRFLVHYLPAVDQPLTEDEERLYSAYYPQHFEDNLRAIIKEGRDRYDRIILMNLATITNPSPTQDELRKVYFPVGMGKNMRKLDRLVQIYNATVEKVAKEEGVTLVDLHSVFDSHEARADLTDSCHVNAAGANRIANALLDGGA